MLFWNDWQLELNVQDSPGFRRVLLVTMTCSLLPLLILAYFEAIFFVIIALVLLQAWFCWRWYWAEQASRRLAALFCKQGQWSARLNNGQCIHDLHLKRYFVGNHFLLVVFQSNQRQGNGEGLRLWLRHLALLSFIAFPFIEQHRFIIFPEQLGEESFRQLLVLLRYRASCLQSE